MITSHPTSVALSLLAQELDSWTKPETDTAFRLQAEAKRPVIDVPSSAQAPMAQVINLVSRLRTPKMQAQMQQQIARVAA